MSRFVLVACALVAACGGGRKPPRAPEIGIYPRVTEQRWYRVTSTCAQGPWDLELAPGAEKWGESIALEVQTPRKLALEARIYVDDKEVDASSGVIGASGRSDGVPDNTRCVADAKERLVLARPGGGGSTPGIPATPGTRVPDAPSTPAPPTVPLELVSEAPPPAASTEIVQVRFLEAPPPGARIRIRLWSIEPNDLEGVLFGAVRVAWRPNVSDTDYERHLAWEREQARLRAERLAAEDAKRPRPAPTTTVVVDDRAARERREAEARRRADEAARRRAKRDAYCAVHREDRGCWGPGGYRVHAELEARRGDRDAYCAVHSDDARCWTDADWHQRRTAWRTRVADASRAQAKPDGPPPAPLAETVPPRLSANAEWRPGYWHWLDGTWVWLAGMWRVPEADIVAEATTTAPAPPPEVRVEQPPPAPVTTAVWIPGFWQWDGATWIWVPGSWQLRPGTSVTWRPTTWRARGTVHVLVPGAWVRIGERR